MNLPFYIARKYLFSKKSTNAINIITLIAAVAIAVITAAMILVLSVFNGFESLVISLNRSFYADMVISPREGKTMEPDSILYNKILAVEGVDVVAPVLQEMAMITYGERRSIPTVKGVDDRYIHVTGIDTSIVQGDYPNPIQGSASAVLGLGIAMELGVPINDPFSGISLTLPRRQAKVGNINPDEAFLSAPAMPMGIFSIQEEFDRKFVITDIELMRNLLDQPTAISHWELSLEKGANENNIKSQLQKICGDQFKLATRQEQDEFIYKIMNTEKWVSFILLSFILIIASFNIFGSLSMLVIEKTPDIGLLKTMGMTNQSINRAIMTLGMLIAVIGVISGWVIGAGFIYLQQKFGIIRIEGDYFLLDYYPMVFEWLDTLAIIAMVLFITWLAALYPSMTAARKASMLDWKNAS